MVFLVCVRVYPYLFHAIVQRELEVLTSNSGLDNFNPVVLTGIDSRVGFIQFILGLVRAIKFSKNYTIIYIIIKNFYSFKKL